MKTKTILIILCIILFALLATCMIKLNKCRESKVYPEPYMDTVLYFDSNDIHAIVHDSIDANK